MNIRELLAQLAPGFAKVLSRFRIPPADGEDLIQDVLLQFLRKQKQIREPEKWLLGALRNQCRMYWRTRGRALTVAVDESILELMAGAGPIDPERQAMERGLLKHIAKLPWNCQSLLRMRYRLGMDVSETAEKSHYKPSSIDKIIRRCVQKLSRKVAAAASALKGKGDRK